MRLGAAVHTGQQQEPGDSALGLYNYKARFYSTTLGRFVSVDPIGSRNADPVTLNSYAYARNNPARWTDPAGTCNPGIDCPGDGLRALARAQRLDPLTPQQWASLADAYSGRIPDFDESQVGHMFRVRKDGLGLENSAENRAWLREMSSKPENLVVIADDGSRWYAVTLPNGKQVWTHMGRSGTIRDGGVNAVPNGFVRNRSFVGGMRRINPQARESVPHHPDDIGPPRTGGILRYGGTLLGAITILDIVLQAYLYEEPDPYDQTQCTRYNMRTGRMETCS